MPAQDDGGLKRPRLSTSARIGELEERVSILESRVLTSVPAGWDRFKETLLDPVASIEARDFLRVVTQRVVIRLSELGETGTPFSDQELRSRLDASWDMTEELRRLLAVAGEWGEERHTKWWAQSVESIAINDEPKNGLVVWLRLRRWPAVLAIYSGALSALAAENYVTLRSLLQDPLVDEDYKSVPAAVALDAGSVFDNDAAKRLDGYDRRHTPVSDYLHERFHQAGAALAGSDRAYDRLFDRMEYFAGLVHLDLSGTTGWAPVGRFAWRRERYQSDDPLRYFQAQFESRGKEWGPIRAGFFAGNAERAGASLEAYATLVTRTSNRMF